MGALRERARAELRDREVKREERKAKEEARRIEEHRESATPVAEFLTAWAGEAVATDQLKREDEFFGGFHSYMTWLVTLDDFDLIVKQEKRSRSLHEEPAPVWKFQIYQRLGESATRPISKPVELLDGVPEAVSE